MKNDRTLWPLLGAAAVAVAMIVVVYFVRATPETASSSPPDRGQTEEQALAGPADRNALPDADLSTASPFNNRSQGV
ncbi:hypothetical protein [Rhizobium sp. RM]|uniref:hypothetical protein n=1 Tax=Rhizobium sp. RM TaxID=2748079 RepID=UPI00110DF0E0|nr:hypothetical protein [Rhizobium sp. RM]NWJ27633.1 hypothetical protein [Rhizobium sp. RM]TMV18904.1 hypothetical protein BJG94_14875 [Rhizobium sp. Td3]